MSVNRLELGTINSPELVLVMDASDNLVIEDTDGNTIIRFNQDQTTDFFADLVDSPNSSVIYDQSAEELTADVNNSSTVTESLVIGGTLYEEDDNSPFTVSSQISSTYTIAGSYDEVIVVPERSNVGHDQLRVNGNSDSNYQYTDNSDSETTGQTEFDLGDFLQWSSLFRVSLNRQNDFLGMNMDWVRSGTGLTVYGRYASNETSLDSFTVLDSGGTNRSLNARVYGRVMGI